MSETFTPVREAEDREYAANLQRANLASTAGRALETKGRDLTQIADALHERRQEASA